MHSLDTKSRFLELRAKDWSLARIATKLKVSKRTLVDWNSQHQAEIRALRAIELEALQEKILATHKQELTCLAQNLQRIEETLAERSFKCESMRDLFRTAALLRSEIRKLRVNPDLVAGPESKPAPQPVPAAEPVPEAVPQPDAS